MSLALVIRTFLHPGHPQNMSPPKPGKSQIRTFLHQIQLPPTFACVPYTVFTYFRFAVQFKAGTPIGLATLWVRLSENVNISCCFFTSADGSDELIEPQHGGVDFGLADPCILVPGIESGPDLLSLPFPS
jgi:hypothetical protein